ncbi:MAG: cupin domain-containing protein [Oscillatoria sp. SIO1A7]|nr:cupin domain-containing protein [Oscillatoria sp. SIO1A7]
MKIAKPMLKHMLKHILCALMVLVLFWSSMPNGAQGEELPNEGPGAAQTDTLEPNLYCPKGTEFDPIASNATKRICDIDSREGKNTDDPKDRVYPWPEKRAYVTNEDSFPKLVNKNYPSWYRGDGENGLADDSSYHFYYSLIGPGLGQDGKPGYNTDNIFCTTFYLKPEKTYIAHNHPSREFYYIIDGEAKWYAGAQTFDVKQGSFIVHPPYISHGFTNTSKTVSLRTFTCWWRDKGDPKDVMNYSGLPVNPCLVESEETAVGYPVDSVCEE